MRNHPRTTARTLAADALTAVTLITAAHPVAADTVKCERAIAKETAKFSHAMMKALTKCEELKRKGNLSSDTSCEGESKTQTALAKADDKLRASIAKACGGKNKTCAATDTDEDADDTLEAIGWDLGSCPNFEAGTCTNAITD